MKEVKPGVYSPAQTPLIEVKARKKDDYKTVCRKAAKACNLKETETRELCQEIPTCCNYSSCRCLREPGLYTSGVHTVDPSGH